MAEVLGEQRRVAVCRELTKPYEEVLRGTVGELAEEVEEILGEITLVVAGAPDAAPDPQHLLDQVTELVERGMRRSEAIAQVAAEAGVSRRELYAQVMQRG
jgi:16S rRNA (cytidine1402-2'-O)-methyltransferase